MKKYLLSLLSIAMAAFMSFNLVSCGDDELEEEKVGSIYGIVTELGTAEPMKAVGVELYKGESLMLKTVTFDDGHFEFNDLTPGKYKVQTVADGYKTASYSVVVEAGRQARADMQLKKLETYMTLTTYNVENITSTGATFKGRYSYTGSNYPSEYGFVYSREANAANGVRVTSTNRTNSSDGVYDFTVSVSNLSAGTYYVKAYAKNSYGTAYGDVKEFVITGNPAVSTLAASNVTEQAATLNGHIDYKGDSEYTERGFVYSYTFKNPTVDDAESATKKVKVSGKSDDFSANVAGLTKNKTYYVRAYVSNNEGTWYGESVSFSTDLSPFIVIEGIGVQKQDLGYGDWYTASEMCEASRVGGFSDWRLPTIAELAILYTHRTEIGGFKSEIYWSSTYDGLYNDISTYVAYSFMTGELGWDFCYEQYNVRAVRTL